MQRNREYSKRFKPQQEGPLSHSLGLNTFEHRQESHGFHTHDLSSILPTLGWVSDLIFIVDYFN